MKGGNMWGALWWQVNGIDGNTSQLMYANGLPLLFRTRQEAREWIREHYLYILEREDLRRPPHGWRLPKPVKVFVSMVKGE